MKIFKIISKILIITFFYSNSFGFDNITEKEIETLTNQLYGCLNLEGTEVSSLENLNPTIYIELNKDRTIKSVELQEKDRISDPSFKKAANIALKVFDDINCKTLELPIEKYELWKYINFTFDFSSVDQFKKNNISESNILADLNDILEISEDEINDHNGISTIESEDDKKVTRAFNYLTSWLLKYKDKSGESDLVFPKNLSFDECYEMQTELLTLNSVDENNLSKNSYDTLMYLADGSGGNPINFHLIASVFNDLCSEFFGKTKDG